MSDIRELQARIEQHEKIIRDLLARTANMSVRSGAGGGGNGTPPLSDTPPPNVVGTASAAGTSEQAARADHKHKGIEYYTATTKGGLSVTATEGAAIGYVNSAPKRVYVDNDGEWVCITHLEAPAE